MYASRYSVDAFSHCPNASEAWVSKVHHCADELRI